MSLLPASASSPSSSALAVLVSVRIDPVSGRATRSRTDAAGVALAMHALGPAAQPLLLCAGPMPEEVARDYLALGVDRLTRLSLPPQDDSTAACVTVLAEACRSSTLVIAGARGESGLASGMLPYQLAAQLQRPLIAEVIDLQPLPGGGWRVVQALPRGARRRWQLDPGQGAVLVSSPRLAQRADLPLRHAWVASRQGRIDDRAAGPSRPGAPAAASASWQHEPARRQRRPLEPVSTESGAARMARATGTAAPARSAGQVIVQGSVEDKARHLLEHLQRLALVRPPA